MIVRSGLDSILEPDRRRARSAKVGLSVPIMLEREVLPQDAPILSSNRSGEFVQVGISREGFARYAFFPCPLDKEPEVVARLHRTLVTRGQAKATVAEAVGTLPIPPQALILPIGDVHQALGKGISEEDIHVQMIKQNHVAVVNGLRIVASPGLTSGQAIVAASPAATGTYTRIGDFLGIQLLQVLKTIVAVGNVLA